MNMMEVKTVRIWALDLQLMHWKDSSWKKNWNGDAGSTQDKNQGVVRQQCTMGTNDAMA